jgi:hypothetical protein
LVFVHVTSQQVEKAVRGFFFQDCGLGEKAVAGAIAGGILLSGFGDGASGVGTVGS